MLEVVGVVYLTKTNMRKGKVQTNEYNVNVLVEHEDCNIKHYSPKDFPVLCKKNDRRRN